MCTERLEQVMSAITSNGLIRAGGLQIVALGSGTPSCARGVLSEMRIDAGAANLRMLTDSKREAYRHFGLHRGVRRTFTWLVPANARGAREFPRQCCVKGRMPGVNAGDPWQQGGMFLLSAKGKTLYELRETSPGWPRMDVDAVVRALRAEVGLPPEPAVQPPAKDDGAAAPPQETKP